MQYKIIYIFLGPPGSGKGVQAIMLGKKKGIPVISTGDIFRNEIKKETELGKKVSRILKSGKLVPEKIVNEAISARLRKRDIKNGFILDGYPRTKNQFDFLLRLFEKKKFSFVSIIIKVSDREVKKRLGGRRICICGESYHPVYKAPKIKNICDKCGAKLFVRNDDSPKVISDRLKIYHKETMPLIKYAEKTGYVIIVEGEKDILGVRKEITAKLKIKK